jgi:alpha-N-acetylglucosaminidase
MMMRLTASMVAVILPHVLVSAAHSAEPAAPEAAARELLGRILPQAVDRFVFEKIPADANRDVFEIESVNRGIVIRGNSGVSMAMGLNWYLKHFCHCHISLCGSQLALPDPLPDVPAKVRKVSWARCRYFLNYCCFGYSLPWYEWDQWQRLIDWMALNGINMPLAVTGQEAVWEGVCRQLGMNDEEIREFLAGPPYLPFQWMGCLDGWGGPLPADWTERHEELGRKILARQRELGMTPVLQGFTGHVPAALKKKFPGAKLHTINWIEWQTHLLDPLDPLFAKVAAMWMQEQQRRFGAGHLYAADTFIEMTPPSGDLKYLADLGRAIYEGMSSHDPNAVWVLQTWIFINQPTFWTQPRIEAFLGAVSDERMICLDLACENRPQWSRTRAFCGKPWLWCNIQNFGNTVFLGGNLQKIVNDLPAARNDPKSGRLVGLGFVNEGLDYNPVVQDLMYEMAWQDKAVDLGKWVSGYAVHRYGKPSAGAEKAWKILLETTYDKTLQGQRSVIVTKPQLGRAYPKPPYDNARLAEAWRLLLDASDDLGKVDTYRFDVVNIGRQVLGNHAATLHGEMVKAYQAKDAPAFEASAGRLLQLIGEIDDLLATREEFLLGRWLADARRWGRTEQEKARLEWNARRVLTLWGEGAPDDYACKDWAGMYRGYYYPRWQQYILAVKKALAAKEAFDAKAFDVKLRKWMLDWSDGKDMFPADPQGDSITTARNLHGKYFLP